MTFSFKNTATKELFDSLEAGVEKDGKTTPYLTSETNGAITLSESAYERAVEARGLTLDQVRSVQELEGQFVTAATAAGADYARGIFADNEDIEQASLVFNTGHNRHTVNYKRDGDVTNIAHVPSISDDGDLADVKSKIAKLFEDE